MNFTLKSCFALSKFIEGKWLDWMDTEFKPQDAEGKLPTSMLFGPQIAQERLMQLCSPEVSTRLFSPRLWRWILMPRETLEMGRMRIIFFCM
jgi:hypothetical protein